MPTIAASTAHNGPNMGPKTAAPKAFFVRNNSVVLFSDFVLDRARVGPISFN